MNALSFELRTPLSAWATGGVSIVPTQPVPTWSAIVGMIGAALGIERGDDRLVRLAQDFALAIRVDRHGQRIEDLHTIQTPSKSMPQVTRVRTRFQELAMDCEDAEKRKYVEANRTVTQREYMADAVYTLFLVQMSDAPVHSLAEIQAAFLRPVYPLFAGRRSCIIGRIQANEVDADVVESATHWDQRIALKKPARLVAERRDLLVGNRVFGVRKECIA